MSKRVVLTSGALALGLLLSACGKYESASFVDNNCSGQAGYYNSDYCAGYVRGAER